MSGALRITWAITGVLTIGFGVLWCLVGTERCLPILADAFPLVLAVAGIIMSYRPPKKERHTLATVVLLVVGILGCVVLELVRSHSETVHNTEVVTLQTKIDVVRDQNTKLLSSLISSPRDTSLSEVEQRKRIEDLLRNEYILSTNPVDPAILAGIKMPPDDWMNEQLAKMGVKWKFKGEVAANAYNAPAEKPEQPRIVFGFYDPNFSDQPATFRIDPMVNDVATFDVGFKVLGSVTAQHVQVWVRKPDSATWVSIAPGYVEMGADHPSDRSVKTESIPPNVPRACHQTRHMRRFV
jgi:hypothetical protein